MSRGCVTNSKSLLPGNKLGKNSTPIKSLCNRSYAHGGFFVPPNGPIIRAWYGHQHINTRRLIARRTQRTGTARNRGPKSECNSSHCYPILAGNYAFCDSKIYWSTELSRKPKNVGLKPSLLKNLTEIPRGLTF